VPAELKFCGLTRSADVAVALALGARHVGVIRARSPRQVSLPQAAMLLRAAGGGGRGVLVLGETSIEAAAEEARVSGAGVVQLHADPTPQDVSALRARFDGEVWAAVRVAGGRVPDGMAGLFEVAHAVVLDAKAGPQLGGTGVVFDWRAVAAPVEAARRGGARLVLAGGIRPENVASAARTLAPDEIDVSSGVERAPGIKDHERMRALTQALWGGEDGWQ
jgi:phosphoribosylanthranilate isomerase